MASELTAALLEPPHYPVINPLIEGTVYHYRQNGFLLHPSGYLVVFLACTVEGFDIPETMIIPLVFSDIFDGGTSEPM